MAGRLARLGSGRLLLAFVPGTGPRPHAEGSGMLAYSADGGRTWDESRSVDAVPGRDRPPIGSLVRLGDGLRKLVVWTKPRGTSPRFSPGAGS